MPPVRRVAVAAGIALSLGLSLIVVLAGFDASMPLRLVETAALGVVAVAALAGAISFLGGHMSDYRDPESEADFERLVLRTERLAREGTAADPDETEFLELDPFDDADFEELVRDALDELPDLLRRALDHNVAVVISDGGRRRRAYGLYHGDGMARDNVPDRIVIYRDTLRRDFGHDPEMLRDQVVRTVRHELAHHIGFDELGVRDLGL